MADEAGLKAIVRAVYAHAHAGDWEACEACLSPDLVTFHLTSRITGKSVAMPLAEVFRIEAGLVTEIRPFYFDPAAVGALDKA